MVNHDGDGIEAAIGEEGQFGPGFVGGEWRAGVEDVVGEEAGDAGGAVEEFMVAVLELSGDVLVVDEILGVVFGVDGLVAEIAEVVDADSEFVWLALFVLHGLMREGGVERVVDECAFEIVWFWGAVATESVDHAEMPPSHDFALEFLFSPHGVEDGLVGAVVHEVGSATAIVPGIMILHSLHFFPCSPKHLSHVLGGPDDVAAFDVRCHER